MYGYVLQDPSAALRYGQDDRWCITTERLPPSSLSSWTQWRITQLTTGHSLHWLLGTHYSRFFSVGAPSGAHYPFCAPEGAPTTPTHLALHP